MIGSVVNPCQEEFSEFLRARMKDSDKTTGSGQLWTRYGPGEDSRPTKHREPNPDPRKWAALARGGRHVPVQRTSRIGVEGSL